MIMNTPLPLLASLYSTEGCCLLSQHREKLICGQSPNQYSSLRAGSVEKHVAQRRGESSGDESNDKSVKFPKNA